MSNRNEKQGRAAESWFTAECEKPIEGLDIIVTKPGEDKRGWDKLIEIAASDASKVPADLHARNHQCFAQIKSNRTSQLTAKIKLSNAISSAQSPSPFFVFMVDYQRSKREGPHLYGRHIWEPEMVQYLKRARTASGRKSKALHKQTVSINFSDEDLIEGHPGQWMTAAINSHGGLLYGANKSKLIGSVGYGKERWRATFSLPSSVSGRDIVNHQLGGTPFLQVENFEAFDIRFETESRIEISNIDKVELTAFPKPQSIRLQIQAQKGEPVEAGAQLICPSLLPMEHEDYRFAVECGPIRILSSPDRTDVETELVYDLKKRHPIEQLLCKRCSDHTVWA